MSRLSRPAPSSELPLPSDGSGNAIAGRAGMDMAKDGENLVVSWFDETGGWVEGWRGIMVTTDASRKKPRAAVVAVMALC